MNLVRSQNLTVAGIAVHQDAEGRYSLNDLHRASGAISHQQPSKFLDNASTDSLVEALLKSPISGVLPVNSVRGRNGGTYVCKELIYAYANWISADFYLKVIRTYDALVTGNTGVLSELLPQPVMKQVGGMMKAVSRKQMDELSQLPMPCIAYCLP